MPLGLSEQPDVVDVGQEELEREDVESSLREERKPFDRFRSADHGVEVSKRTVGACLRVVVDHQDAWGKCSSGVSWQRVLLEVGVVLGGEFGADVADPWVALCGAHRLSERVG
jgi:hypothetical protein